MFLSWWLRSHNGWKLIERSTVKAPACSALFESSPLFEEKWNTCCLALFLYGLNPIRLNRASPTTTLSSYNHPVDDSQVQLSEVLKQRLDRQKTDSSSGAAEFSYAWQSSATILNADSPPDVAGSSSITEFRVQQASHAVRALRKYLVGMPVSFLHHPYDVLDVGVWNSLMEEVAHRIDKDHPRSLPPKRLYKFFGYEPKVKALLIRVPGHPPETLCEGFGVTVGATGTNLGAPAHGIPRRIRPFDLRLTTHLQIA